MEIGSGRDTHTVGLSPLPRSLSAQILPPIIAREIHRSPNLVNSKKKFL